MTTNAFSAASVFSRRDPQAGQRAPVVFDIPRSGREYPSDFRTSVSFDDLHSSVSKHLETLYGDVVEHGATWLYARFPNAYIDANRNELDIDPDTLDGAWPGELAPTDKSRAGIGLIPQVVRGKLPLYAGKLSVADVQARLQHYYWPYHHALADLLKGLRDEYGVAYHLSCHSMGSIIPAGGKGAGELRSEFDLGDRHGTTADPAFVDFLQRSLQDLGYQVTRNVHFAGAEAIRKHGRPDEGIHSVQIEMRRNLYMNEATGEAGANFDQVRRDMTALAAKVAEYAQARR